MAIIKFDNKQLTVPCLTKEEILSILGYEEIDITVTDEGGRETVAHVLGWVEEIIEPTATWYASAYSGSLRDTSVTVDRVIVKANGQTIGDTRNVEIPFDLDGNGGCEFGVVQPETDTPLEFQFIGVNCPSGKSDYQGTANLVFTDEGPYIEDVSFTGTGCIEIEAVSAF